MEVNTSVQKVFVGILILAVVVIGGLVVWSAFKNPEDITPRTAVERSVIDAQQVVRKDPSNSKARLKLAMAYTEAGRYNNASSELNIAVKLNPNDPEIYFGIGIVSHKTGDFKTAIKALKRATKTEGTVADIYREAYFELGEIYFEQKNYKEAVKAFEGSYGYGPEIVYIDIALAKAYEKVNNIEKALKTYKQALRYDPSNKEVSDAVKRLSAAPKKSNQKGGGK